MAATSIEWTDWSINPIRCRNLRTGTVGHFCQKVSAGCTHCYASALQRRFNLPPFDGEHRNHPPAAELWSDGTVHVAEDLAVYLDDRKLQDILRRRRPTKIFWCDMSDLFGWWVPDEWIDRCFATMALTPQHTHQVLTKRPERMAEYVSSASHLGIGLSDGIDRMAEYADVPPREIRSRWPLPNVWLGTSVENQQQADARIPHLLGCPAAVRFLSCEPLLGPIEFRWQDYAHQATGETYREYLERTGAVDQFESLQGIDWVIVGGESGPYARPCRTTWVRDIVHQCVDAGVACFVKQLGSNAEEGHGCHRKLSLVDRKGGDWDEWPADLRVRQFPQVSSLTPQAST